MLHYVNSKCSLLGLKICCFFFYLCEWSCPLHICPITSRHHSLLNMKLLQRDLDGRRVCKFSWPKHWALPKVSQLYFIKASILKSRKSSGIHMVWSVQMVYRISQCLRHRASEVIWLVLVNAVMLTSIQKYLYHTCLNWAICYQHLESNSNCRVNIFAAVTVCF